MLGRVFLKLGNLQFLCELSGYYTAIVAELLSMLEEIFSLIWKWKGLYPSKVAFSHALEEPWEVDGTAESSGVVVLQEMA